MGISQHATPEWREFGKRNSQQIETIIYNSFLRASTITCPLLRGRVKRGLNGSNTRHRDEHPRREGGWGGCGYYARAHVFREYRVRRRLLHRAGCILCVAACTRVSIGRTHGNVARARDPRAARYRALPDVRFISGLCCVRGNSHSPGGDDRACLPT